MKTQWHGSCNTLCKTYGEEEVDTMLWITAAVLIDAAAVCAWIFLISRFDKHRRQKNQTRLLVYFYLIGMGSCIVSAVTYYPLSWIVRPLYGGRWDVNYFFYHLLVVGPGEELIKFLAFAFLAVKLGTIKELKDGILQACSTALGFAAVENFKYGWYFGLDILIARFYRATVGHVLLAVIWGAVFAVVFIEYWDEPRKARVKYILSSLIPAALFHGLGNFFLEINLFFVSSLVDILTGIIGIFLFTYLRKHSPYRELPLSQYKVILPHIYKALRRHPEDFDLNYRAGKYNLYGKRYPPAANHFQICTGKKPKSASVRLLHGVSLLGSGDRGEAEKVFSNWFSNLDETQKYLVMKKLEPYRLGYQVERDLFSRLGIDEWVRGYRIEKVRRGRYVDRNGKPYKRHLDEKTEELRSLLAE